MPPMRLTDRKPLFAGIILTSLALCWFYALSRGQDANWDQLNYHLAVPFLLLHGQLWDSVAPAGIQSYFNPLIFLPGYWVVTHLPPIAASLVFASEQAVAFMIAGWICLTLAPPTREGRWMAIGGFVLCLTSPMALSEAGTTDTDVITAIPVLLAYYLLMTRESARSPLRACLFAGVLLGAAGALKLTNLLFVFGVPGFLLAGTQPWRQRLALLATTALATVAAFLLLAAWWHVQLWQRFGNPVFPYYNNIFRSPDFPATPLVDPRFGMKSAWDLLRFPLYWLVGGSPTPSLKSPAAEVDPRDARFVLVIIGLACLTIASTIRPNLRRRVLAHPASGLLFAWVAVYVVWLAAFGIHRYMIALEILTGAVLLWLFLQIGNARLRHALLAATCLATVIVLHVPSWERLPFAAHWRTIAAETIPLSGRPLIFLADLPTAFVSASLPTSASYVGLAREIDLSASAGTSLTRQIAADLADPARTPYVLFHSENPTPVGPELRSWHVSLGPDCQSFELARRNFTLCTRVPQPPG